MLPASSDFLNRPIKPTARPTNTHKYHMETKCIQAYTNELDAMRQFIYITLNIERYKHEIFSWNVGVELVDLFGEPKTYVIPEIERRIREALLYDERILSVDEFGFEAKKHRMIVTFTVKTIFGEIEYEKAVLV